MYALYCAGMLGMNVLAAKQIDIFGFTVTCGIFLSGFVFVSQDIITELCGPKPAKKMVFISYAIVLAIVLLFQVAIAVPGSQFWDNQEAFSSVLKTTLRITCASVLAYALGSLTNITVMAKLKGKSNLFARALTSTLFGQLLDNGIFCFVAFLGVLPVKAILSMVLSATVIEVVTEFICFPLVKYLLALCRKNEEKDVEETADAPRAGR